MLERGPTAAMGSVRCRDTNSRHRGRIPESSFRSLSKSGCRFFDRQRSAPCRREINVSRASWHIPTLIPHFRRFPISGCSAFRSAGQRFPRTPADPIDPFSLTAMRALVTQTSLQNQAAPHAQVLAPDRTREIFESLTQAEEWLAGWIKFERQMGKGGLLVAFSFWPLVRLLQIFARFFESTEGIVVGLQRLAVLADCSLSLPGDVE